MFSEKRRAKKLSHGRRAATAPWVRGILIALAVVPTVGLLLLLGAAALLLKTADPGAHHRAAGVGICFACTMLGGLLAARVAGRRAPVLCGLGTGLALFLLLSLGALLLPSGEVGEASGLLRLLLRLAVIPTALCGALLGSRAKKRRRRH